MTLNNKLKGYFVHMFTNSIFRFYLISIILKTQNFIYKRYHIDNPNLSYMESNRIISKTNIYKIPSNRILKVNYPFLTNLLIR